MPKKSYKSVPWLFGKEIEIPEEWEVRKLNTISKIIDSLHSTPKYSEKGYSMVRSTDIKYGNLNLENTLRVSKEVFEEFTKKYLPKKMDILMSRVGTYGVVSYVNTNEHFCLGQNTLIINSHMKYFLYLILSSNLSKNQIDVFVDGSSQKTITLKNIQKLKILYPPLSEQQQIASILSNVDNLIQNTDKLIEKTTRLKKGLMQELLTRGIGHTKFKKVPWLFGKEIEMPEEWEIILFKKIIKNGLSSGLYAPVENYGFGDKIVGLGDIFKNDILNVEKMKKVNLSDAEKKRFILKSYDLVFSRYSLKFEGVGKCLYIPEINETILFESNTLRATLDLTNVNSRFFAYYFSTGMGRNSIIRILKQVSSTGITGSDLKNTKILLPPLPEQQQIASILSNTDEKIQSYERYKEKLQRLKTSLMQKLLTGEVRVAV